jgi:DNA-binding MurR/RpiR family transcriptional regulator
MFQTLIREAYNGLTPGFRRLADFIVNNTLEAAFLTAVELARRVDVDQATVVRFAQEIGYPGYRDLAREIKQYVRDQITLTYRRGEENQQEEEILRTLHKSLDRNLQYYFTTDLPQVAKAIKVLHQAPHVWVVGESISHNLAQIFATELNYIGIQTTVLEPTLTESALYLEQMQANEVLFAIEVIGVSLDTGYIIKLARQKGLTTICLTGYGTMLPAREAEIALVTPTKTPTGVPSFAIPMILTSFIWETLSILRPEQSVQTIIQAFENLSELRALRANTPSFETH